MPKNIHSSRDRLKKNVKHLLGLAEHNGRLTPSIKEAIDRQKSDIARRSTPSFVAGLKRGHAAATRAKAALTVRRVAKPMGKFSVHAGTNLRFFDVIAKAQDFAERFPAATVRRDYGDDAKGYVDAAQWNGVTWTYFHRKASKKKR